MSTNVKQLFEKIWNQYVEVTPSAERVHALLANGKEVINDHVAYRTFNLSKVNLDTLAHHLIELGYKECGEYHFEAKKLYAKHFEHADSTLPKVFISELLVEKLSPEAQIIINRIVADIDHKLMDDANILYAGRIWDISHDEYQLLAKESEYAAWLSAWGFRANHFTVSINHLNDFNCIKEVNQAIKDGGFRLNNVGGEIKGDETVMLEQSSTMADKAQVRFKEGMVEIPSCFYEFAKRYPKLNGQIYTGFVAASADKIFESTNNGK
ncbi:DUF1338 domain-containing protein [Thalassotalea sp. HSM 43]|uniref:DUF1338 domain-containing protein n=1 Tax=Thalassotalea sp. HSM 43 TaxID=2552945 RepID=UPI0010815790|nr:DUF1338 domain-containing protein [Thalassotalea sp. HSM 43]QBY03919.1 DUF1338 domain-containing protein [Thalassotalea sp. HSM 43]